MIEDHGPLLPADGQEMLQRVRSAAQRMVTLIDGLLRLSKVTRSELRSAAINISHLSREQLDALATLTPERAVSVDIEPGITITGDPDLWRVAVDNLLDNAWKYTSRKSQAQIRIHRIEVDGRAGFTVADDGAGFDMRYGERLFSAFQRLHHPDEFSGHGIGLATVKRIVQRHRGTITAEASPERGARFTILLHGCGRDSPYGPPPTQIRTCSITAYGSHLG